MKDASQNPECTVVYVDLIDNGRLSTRSSHFKLSHTAVHFRTQDFLKVISYCHDLYSVNFKLERADIKAGPTGDGSNVPCSPTMIQRLDVIPVPSNLHNKCACSHDT